MPFNTVREMAAMRAIERSLSRTLAQRQIRKAQIRAAEVFQLAHRGAWLIRDIGKEAPMFPPAEAAVELLAGGAVSRVRTS